LIVETDKDLSRLITLKGGPLLRVTPLNYCLKSENRKKIGKNKIYIFLGGVLLEHAIVLFIYYVFAKLYSIVLSIRPIVSSSRVT
jgi:hypothetical protein